MALLMNGKIINDLRDEMGWFDVSTLKEPIELKEKNYGF